VRRESAREQNECDYDEPNQRADNEAQDEREVGVLATEVLDDPNDAGVEGKGQRETQPWNSEAPHPLKLSVHTLYGRRTTFVYRTVL
jgi:hypothetical protein